MLSLCGLPRRGMQAGTKCWPANATDPGSSSAFCKRWPLLRARALQIKTIRSDAWLDLQAPSLEDAPPQVTPMVGARAHPLPRIQKHALARERCCGITGDAAEHTVKQ